MPADAVVFCSQLIIIRDPVCMAGSFFTAMFALTVGTAGYSAPAAPMQSALATRAASPQMFGKADLEGEHCSERCTA